MDLHYKPGSFYRNRDGERPSEIARQRPALAPRIQGHESYEDFDDRRSLRGGHFTEEEEMPRPEPMRTQHFVMDEEDHVERFNRQLRGGHTLNERD